jgi:hypothetical protein
MEDELRKKVKTLRIFICVLLVLTSFQSAFLYLLSKGIVPSSLVVVKEVVIKEDNNISNKHENIIKEENGEK